MANAALHDLFESLWLDYTAFNPRAKKIYDLLLAREKNRDSQTTELVNDHVALRTYDVGQIDLENVARIFTQFGYEKRGEYIFADKKLFAWHLEHEDERLPKVFVSQLETAKLSAQVQRVASEVARSAAKGQGALKPDFLWSRRSWPATHAMYLSLLEESEYAAWLYAFGFRSNHFTISMNHLQSFTSLEELNRFVVGEGYALNSAGGEIKGTPELYLEQSSTLAEKTKVEFSDGVFEIPACYYEFARRYKLPNGKLYQGFVASSADKIFESTNVRN